MGEKRWDVDNLTEAAEKWWAEELEGNEKQNIILREYMEANDIEDEDVDW